MDQRTSPRPSTPIDSALIRRWIAVFKLVRVIKPSDNAVPDLLNDLLSSRGTYARARHPYRTRIKRYFSQN